MITEMYCRQVSAVNTLVFSVYIHSAGVLRYDITVQAITLPLDWVRRERRRIHHAEL